MAATLPRLGARRRHRLGTLLAAAAAVFRDVPGSFPSEQAAGGFALPWPRSWRAEARFRVRRSVYVATPGSRQQHWPSRRDESA